MTWAINPDIISRTLQLLEYSMSISASHELFSFNNKKWRAMIGTVCRELDQEEIGIEVISPFGFELLGDRRFLSGNLKRFYCYIGIPKNRIFSSDEKMTFIQNFSDRLFQEMVIAFPKMVDHFVLKIHQEQFIKLRHENYSPNPKDKLLDIQLRSVSSSILDDYADYIIATLTALYHDKDEVRFFMHNTRFRSRTFQLYIMQECLFKDWLPPLNETETILYKSIFSKIRNNVDIFFIKSKLDIIATEEELYIMQQLVRPRVELMMKAAGNQPDLLDLEISSYHVPDTLKLKIGSGIYTEIKAKIKNTYLHYE